MLRRHRAPKPIAPWTGPKPTLPMRVTYLCRVHYLDLQDYLATVYRMRDYDILRTTGATHGLCPEFVVTGQMPPASNAGQQADNIRRGRKTRNLGLILNVLCVDGFIPKGKYVIDTSAPPNPIAGYTELLNEHHDPNHPECMAFRLIHPDPEFQRRANVLDKLTREDTQRLEKPDEGKSERKQNKATLEQR